MIDIISKNIFSDYIWQLKFHENQIFINYYEENI